MVLLLAYIQTHLPQMAEHNRHCALHRALRRLDVLHLAVHAPRLRVPKSRGGVEVADRDAARGPLRE